jgi:type VI secretion system secreted protein VgrG
MPRSIRVSTPLPEGTLLFESMTGDEGLSRPFRYEVHLLSSNSDLDLSALLGKPMVVVLDAAHGAERQFTGLVSRISMAGTSGRNFRYVATLRPWLWMLSHKADCRIFQNMTVPDIVKQIFRESGFSDFEESLSGTYRTWDFSVQYRESDFNYVSRLLEQEGIYYFFRHGDDKHTLVLADSPGAHKSVTGYKEVAYFAPGPDHGADEDRIHSWNSALQVRPGVFATTDFDFERPKADLSARLDSSATYPYGNLEVFDYPGEYVSSSDGEQEVRVRLEELQTEYEMAQGAGSVRGVGVGDLFTLTDCPRADQNHEYLIVTATYILRIGSYEGSSEGDDEPDFQSSVSAIDSKVNFRPRQLTSKPSVDGPQTAIVVGQAGDEITVDQYGRVKVQFHWDREGKNDEHSSCWVRVAQLWAGSGWGGIHIPRIGQEVIVDFLEGDPDRPIITGRVYNADNMPPYPLPDNKTQSGIKSRSTKSGAPSNFNELRFEDKKGSELVNLQAEKDLTSLVKHDEDRNVGNDRTTEIGHDETITVGNNRTETVSKQESITIGGDRQESVGKSETVSIGTTRALTVGTDETIQVGGKRADTVAKDESTTVGGNQSLSVGKNQSVDVGGGLTLSVGKDEGVTVGGNLTVSVSKGETRDIGKKLSITAADQITLTSGSASITLKSNGDITINGANITLKGSGKINIQASSDVVIKGSKVSQN